MFQIVLFTTMLTYGADSIPASIAPRAWHCSAFPVSSRSVGWDRRRPGHRFGYPALFVLASAASLTSWLLVWRLPLLPILGHRPRRGFWGRFRPAKSPSPVVGLLVQHRYGDLSSPLPGPTWAIGALARPVFQCLACPPPRCELSGEGATTEFRNALSSPDLLAYGSGLVLMAIAANTAVIVMAALAAGMAHGALFPILTSQVVSRARTAERGSAMSIYTLDLRHRPSRVRPAVGLVIDGFDYRTAFSAVAVMLGIGAVVYSLWDRWLVPRRRRSWPESASIGEEIAEQGGGLAGEDPIDQVDPVVEPAVLRDVVERPGRLPAQVSSPIDDAIEAGQYRAPAHIAQGSRVTTSVWPLSRHSPIARARAEMTRISACAVASESSSRRL